MPTRPLDRLMFAQGGLCFFCKDPLLKCPNASQRADAEAPSVHAKPKAAQDRYGVVVANLRQRGAAKPKTVKTLTSTIRSLFQKDITDKELCTILQQLEAEGVLTIEGAKVTYAS